MPCLYRGNYRTRSTMWTLGANPAPGTIIFPVENHQPVSTCYDNLGALTAGGCGHQVVSSGCGSCGGFGTLGPKVEQRGENCPKFKGPAYYKAMKF